WSLLVDNEYTDNPAMVNAARNTVVSYAISIMESPTEVIMAFNRDLQITMSTNEITIWDGERQTLEELYAQPNAGLIQLPIGGIDRVAMGFYFEPFDWYMLVTEQKSTFYRDVDKITVQSTATLVASIVLAVILLFIISRLLTRPLIRVVNTMKDIISYSDLSQRVPVEFQDETGELAHTFNIMVGELEKAYNNIKKYAFEAVISQKRETKIRNIFQKYVPQELIDKYLGENPESLLIGDNRVLAILFSDIRGFTTISEKLPPDEIVNSLNRYFSVMVDVILSHKGIVDKYIGDAIMAFFGAPVKHEDDAIQSVYAGIEMTERVVEFNREQEKMGKPPFHIGVGINYGIVTVGNIGTEKKMDYTVIGDMVNFASRLESLTKYFKQELLISESLARKVKDNLVCRELGRVQVKGKTEGIKIFTTKRKPTDAEREAWDIHNRAMPHYYAGEFQKAAHLFESVLRILPNDFAALKILEKSLENLKYPPEHWTGVEKMETK
ncbi:MAG TPA: HAMP domain-containing protein, partial [Spirochaetia bacterium]|nr:HAMP domain-containing protein [Spirochaetia bacterium]